MKSYNCCFALLSVSVIIFISCKKNELPGDNNNNVLTDCDIKYIKYASGAYEWKYTFDNFDPRKLVEARYLYEDGTVHDSYRIYYDLTNINRVTAVQEWYYDFETLHYVDSFFYNDEGRLDMEIVYYNAGATVEPGYYYQFYYNADHTIDYIESFDVTSGLLSGSKEFEYNDVFDVTKVTYFDDAHSMYAYAMYERTEIFYGHYNIFDQILQPFSWTHAPDKITLFYSGFGTTVTNYVLTPDASNYLVHTGVIISPLGITDTVPERDYEYQCFN